MENKEEGVKDEKGCCGTSKKSCCCKALCAAALLLVGGVGGFFAGRCGKVCPAPTSVSAPAAPAQAPTK